jgi:hypothetical protein
MDIKSPQITRVLVKWIEELSSTLFKPKDVLATIKNGFKHTSKSTAIYLTEAMKHTLADKLLTIAESEVSSHRKLSEQSLLMFIS